MKQSILDYWNKVLPSTVEHAMKTKYYRDIFEKNGLKPSDIRTIEDLPHLPPTTQEDFSTRSLDFLAAEKKKLRLLSTTSGTTGSPKLIFFTQNDIDIMARRHIEAYGWHGLSENDVVAVATSYSNPPLGLYYQTPFERLLGALHYPMGLTGNISKQARTLGEIGTTILVSHPSIVMKLSNDMRGAGMDPREIGIKKIILSGEPLSDSYRRKIEAIWEASVILGYGSMEADFIAIECPSKDGLHLFYRDFIIEIENGNEFKSEGEGEFLITFLSFNGMALLRYRIGDYGRISYDAPECGIELPTLTVCGRGDDVIILAGDKIFPAEIEQFMLSFKEIIPPYKIILSEERGVDKFVIHLISNRSPSEREVLRREMMKRTAQISYNMKQLLAEGTVIGDIQIHSPEDYPFKEDSGKRKIEKVIDSRNRMKW